jgi:hypothetical protein
MFLGMSEAGCGTLEPIPLFISMVPFKSSIVTTVPVLALVLGSWISSARSMA